jgi:hypothetical protein
VSITERSPNGVMGAGYSFSAKEAASRSGEIGLTKILTFSPYVGVSYGSFVRGNEPDFMHGSLETCVALSGDVQICTQLTGSIEVNP